MTSDLKYLIEKIKKTRKTKKGPKKNNSTEICLVGTFWLNSKERKKTDELKKEIAKEEKIDYVSLKKIAGNFHNSYHSHLNAKVMGDDHKKHSINNPAVANHPSDKGFKHISSKIMETFRKSQEYHFLK